MDLLLQLEMILQAQEYEEQQNINLQEFFDSTAGKFKSTLGQAWAEEIIRRRGP
jgi:putative hydrolases of HD superfamily